MKLALPAAILGSSLICRNHFVVPPLGFKISFKFPFLLDGGRKRNNICTHWLEIWLLCLEVLT